MKPFAAVIAGLMFVAFAGAVVAVAGVNKGSWCGVPLVAPIGLRRRRTASCSLVVVVVARMPN
jgi:hypothetical protein